MTSGFVGSTAEKSLSVSVFWEALRRMRRRGHGHTTQPPLGSRSLLCLLHAFIYLLIHSFSHSCHTCFGSGLLLDGRNKEKKQMAPALWEHLECVGVEGVRTNH